MKAIEYLEEQKFGYDHFTKLTSTGINPDNDNIAQFAEDYHKAKLNLLTIPVVKHRFSTPEKMAEWLHNNYEEIALNNGWKTQDDCQVPFCDLPTENRLTMIELCIRYLNGA